MTDNTIINFGTHDRAVSYRRAASTIKIRNNPYRPDNGLKPANLQIEALIAQRRKNLHLLVIDKSSADERQYELKLQVIARDTEEKQPEDPLLSPDSQKSITSPTRIEIESLAAKRHPETRIYLRHIKSGHDNIRNLEAFHQYRDGKRLMMAHFYTFSSFGSARQLRGDLEDEGAELPEMFLWKIYLQIIDALAFLHNEHPKYRKHPEHANRQSILCPELSADNVYFFLPDDSGDERYPTLKLGDLGNSVLVPVGEGFTRSEAFTAMNEVPPEINYISAKSDIWRAGSIIFRLAKNDKGTMVRGAWKGPFYNLPKEKQQAMAMDPGRVRPIGLQYSDDLNNAIQRALVFDYHQRPSAAELLDELGGPAKLRIDARWMYRELPDWMGDHTIMEGQHFSQERLDKLLRPGQLEAERQVEKERIKDLKRQRLFKMEAKKVRAAALNLHFSWRNRHPDCYDDLEPFTINSVNEVFELWRVARRAGKAAGTWIDPGPPMAEVTRLAEEEKKRRKQEAGEAADPQV